MLDLRGIAIKVVDQYKGRGYSDIFEIHTLGLVFGFGIFFCLLLLFEGGPGAEIRVYLLGYGDLC